MVTHDSDMGAQAAVWAEQHPTQFARISASGRLVRGICIASEVLASAYMGREA
jgi:hypothetical protein